MLKASFEIYRYTKLENGTYDWLPAVDFKENAAKDRKSVIWGNSAQDKAQTFNVNADGSYNLDLEPAAGTGDTEGHLYKLIESKVQRVIFLTKLLYILLLRCVRL